MSGLGDAQTRSVSSQPRPTRPDSVSPFNEAIAGVTHETDEILGIVFILAITLHIAGALKHHLMDKNGTLRRMLGKNSPPKQHTELNTLRYAVNLKLISRNTRTLFLVF